MNLILFDDHAWDNLLPLTFTRPVSEIRCGILTLREKWEKILGIPASWLCRDYLQEKFPLKPANDNILINSALFPNKSYASCIDKLAPGEAMILNNRLVAARMDGTDLHNFREKHWIDRGNPCKEDLVFIDYPWHIFSLNGEAIKIDFELLTAGRKSAGLSGTVNTINPKNIFVEEGFRGEYITLNASSGPIYLGKESEIMEGALIRGAFALGEHSVLKLGTKIYGPTTIGPECKVGGEVNNSVIFAYSNKAHDGFLGNAVIGEWCNLGADTNNSNLKNNYAEVKVWNYPAAQFISTGLQFCGLIMGDHSKCGINTMFNTGTVVGVSANIFGAGFPRNFIPSFSWGGASGMIEYKTSKAFETAALVMGRRGIILGPADKAILEHVYDLCRKEKD